jgi:predicted ATPase
MLIEQLTLTNLLSFGPNTEPLELRPLNVVIGANGSGKSNLLEAIDLLRNAPEQIAKPIREGGGIRDWLWKGGKGTPAACIDAVVAYPIGPTSLRYIISITKMFEQFRIADERIENDRTLPGHRKPNVHYQFEDGFPVLDGKLTHNQPHFGVIDVRRSILVQRRDPNKFPEITYLAETLPNIRLYREWSFGRESATRLPQKGDMPNDALEPDCGNLGLVLNRLRRDPAVKARLLEALRQLYDGIDDYDVKIEGGSVQVFFNERGMKDIVPATRLSDGTLRYLCLLAILCHPNPPPLVCIEEPELGLHPDILPSLAVLLREASERCQLIVTTHSDMLVDAMNDTPEAVVVCEKHDGATTMKRSSADQLKPWLARYRLGELWSSGHIGGTRW